MLYKYVKKQPVSIRIKPSTQLYPARRSKTILSLAFLALAAGLISLSYSVYPYASAAFYNSAENVEKNIITSASLDDEVPTLNSTGSLSSVYVSNLYKNLATTNKDLNLFDENSHPEIVNKTGLMKITIAKLNIENMPVALNVNSYNEKDYLPILENKLAHFKGSSIPGFSGNSFIYGHSANELYARANPRNPQIVFTFLNKLDIGDEIKIELDGKNYSYKVQKSKIVEPQDISPILTKSEKKTVTLMTCWPPGVGEKRLIIVADQV